MLLKFNQLKSKYYKIFEISPRECYWMLSNNENREGMRCKLVENLQFDTHLEASRLRDYSNYTYFKHEAKVNESLLESEKSDNADNLAQNLQLNKQAINNQINEDLIPDDEFLTPEQRQAQSTQKNLELTKTKSSISNASTSSTTSQPTQKSLVPQEHIDLFPKLEEKEKLILKTECELITATRVVKGRFELTNKYIYFFDTFSSFYYEQTSENDSAEAVNENGNQNSSIFQPAASFNGNTTQGATSGYSCHDFEILNDFKLSLVHLQEVQLRRYNLRRSALEFFQIDKSNHFINFNKSVSFIFVSNGDVIFNTLKISMNKPDTLKIFNTCFSYNIYSDFKNLIFPLKK